MTDIPHVTGAEKTAGTELAPRFFAPKDVVDMVGAHVMAITARIYQTVEQPMTSSFAKLNFEADGLIQKPADFILTDRGQLEIVTPGIYVTAGLFSLKAAAHVLVNTQIEHNRAGTVTVVGEDGHSCSNTNSVNSKKSVVGYPILCAAGDVFQLWGRCSPNTNTEVTANNMSWLAAHRIGG